MKYGIVTDSSCDLRHEDMNLENIDFSIVPLTITVSEKEFIDDDNIDIDEFLRCMKESDELSKTACPSPGDFQKTFDKSDIVFCFCMTGELSGTYNSARIAREMSISEEGNEDKKILVIDTKSTAGTLEFMVKECAKLIEEGKSFEEISDILTEVNKKQSLIFVLGNFDNLMKSGRMSHIKGLIASKLHISLICEEIGGKIEIHSRVRGINKSYQKMVNLVFEKTDHSKDIYIHHVNNLKSAEKIEKLIFDKDSSLHVETRQCKGLTSFYTGETGILISY